MDDGERVELRWTLVDAARLGRRVEVAVGAARGTTFGALRDRLVAELGSTADSFRCDGVTVPGSARFGTAPLLDGAMLVTSGPPGAPEAPGLLSAHVVAGPAAGSVVSLPPGRHPVGRAGSGLRLADPDVSRAHAVLDVSASGTTVADAGSRHGTRLDGEPVGRDPVPVTLGARLRFGASTVVLRGPAVQPAALVPDGLGHLLLNRRPHLATPRPEAVVPHPEEPATRAPARLPWLTMLLPLAVSVAVALIARQPLFLLFALTTPALMAGQYLADRRAGGRERRERAATYAAERAAAQAATAEALAADAAHLEAEFPDLAGLLETATRRTADLWHRSGSDAGRLRVRVGRGRADSTVRRQRGGPPLVHEDVPVGPDLGEVRVLGVAGPRGPAVALVRSLLGQVAVLHSPLDVSLTAVEASPSSDWAWLPWLPHATESAARQVILLDGAGALRREPRVAGWLTAAAEGGGPVLICLEDDVSRLPLECAATVVLDGGETAQLRRAGAGPEEVRPDLPDAAWTERIARALAPVRDASPAGAATACPDLATLWRVADGVDVRDPADLARHWRRPAPPGCGPAATLGVRPGAGVTPFRVDLVRDGPHLLVGGTTGSGKSHLLAAFVTGLAADRGPDEVSFLLVDYKGGAAFAGCAGLPHVAGVVTDLDQHLAERAITSLGAELERRERLLAAAGCADVEAYGRLRAADPDRLSGGLPALPRLVVVVDEFRVLAEELPDFVGGLVRVAGLGRSLGVHLALATQRPAGAVSPEIRANTSLRIALRVQEAGDSHDILGVAEAAAIPASAPGRALARTGEGELVELQVAPLATTPDVGVVIERLNEKLRPVAVSGASTVAEDDTVVAATVAAAGRLGLARATAPWQPPLPQLLAWAPGPDDGVTFGLADLPAEQVRQPAAWSPGHGHLGVVGGPRSGRTTTLLTVAHALARRGEPTALHLYGVDATAGTTGLGELAALPHCGAIVPAGDTRRCTRLLTRLRETVERRRTGATGPRPATVVLLIDGWESVASAWAGVEHGRLTDELLALLREGTAHGVHVVVAGGRSVLTGPLSSSVTDRVVLRFADPLDAALAGVPVLRGAQPPGRGFQVGAVHPRPVEVQVALPPDVPEVAAPLTGGPFRLLPVPDSVSVSDLEAGAGLAVPIGLGGDDASTRCLRLDGPGVTVVHGPAGSGRSTTLAVLEAGLRAVGAPVVRLDPASVSAPPGAVLLVDDAAKLAGAPAEEVVAARLREREPRVVLVTGPGDLVTAFRGPLAEARTARRGVVLGTLTPADAGLLGLTPATTTGNAGPGLGLLVDGGGPVALRVARLGRD